MGVSTVILNNTTLMTVNDTTATASDVSSGTYFYGADGVKTAGTATAHAIGVNDTTDAAGGTIREFVGVDLGSDTVTAEHLELGYTAHDATGTAITGTMPAPTGDVSRKDVNFYDYDGTLVASKTKAEINAMTSDSDLPANPTHTGLTAQGWNWTVAQLKAQLTAMPDQPIDVGQMYITASGATEIDVVMQEGRLSPIMTICVNGEVSIDWGDGTTPDSVTGTSISTRLAPQHMYASAGSYTIKISSVSGTYSFYGDSQYTLLRKNTTGTQNRVYSNCIQHIRIGSGITSISSGAFQTCYSLASVTIPSDVTSIGSSAFYSCYSLASVTIPSNVTSIGSNAFYYCTSLASITIPSGVTSIDNNAFVSCYSLASVTIPSGVTSIGTTVFNNCYSLASITIPDSVTSIGSSVFNGCYALASITIPSSVTSIGTQAFNSCYGMAEYHFQRTTPPTLTNTNTFTAIVSDCVMYVPYSADHSVLTAYQTASIWSNYASYMQEEPAP